jgi:hypothetical protein
MAHQVAVGLLDNIAEVNADAKFNALVEPNPCVAVDHGVLHFERAAARTKIELWRDCASYAAIS